MQNLHLDNHDPCWPPAREDLRIPDSITLQRPLRGGYRSQVYEARFRGRRVVLKRYTRECVKKCQQRIGQSIAEFEFTRNEMFYRHPILRSFVAEPLVALRQQDGWTEAFVQQYVSGITVADFLKRVGKLTLDFVRQVEFLCQAAWAAGLCDLDLQAKNVMAVHASGRWRPVLFDFNMLPKNLKNRNPLYRLMFKLGLRDPAYRDRRWLNRLRCEFMQDADAGVAESGDLVRRAA